MTFSSHVFPKTIFSIPYLVFFTLLLLTQFVGCFQLLSTTWDFAIVHGQQVTFASISSSGPKQVISIPAPKSSIYDQWLLKNSTLNLNFNVKNNTSTTTTNNTGSERKVNKIVSPAWHKGQSFKKLELDVERGLLFLTSYPWNLQSLVVFNITSNETYSLIMNESSAPITGLIYHDEWLYWTNKTSNAIWRMNTSNDIKTWKPEAEPFYKPSSSPECTLSELAIDAKTNKFFFINTCKEEYKIQYYNGTHTGIVRESNNELRALTTDASFLYWVDHPGDFSIQRVSLSNLNGMSQILYNGKTQFINSVSIVGCSQNENNPVTESLLWANCNSKAVIQRDDFSGDGVMNTKTRYFGRFCPRGLISRSFALKDWGTCKKTLTTNVSSTALPSKIQPSSPIEQVFPSMSLTTTSTERTSTTITPKVSSTTSSSTTTTTSTSPTTTTTTTQSTTTTTLSSTTSTTPITTTTTTSPRTTIKTNAPTTTTPSSTTTSTATTAIKAQNVSSKLTSSSVPQSHPLYYPSGRTVTGTLDIALIVTCSCLLILVVILLIAVVFLYRKVRRLQQKPRIRRRVIVSRSRDNNSVPSSSMCELIDIENCCNMNECETPCYERLGSGSTNSTMHQDYKSEGKARTEDKERLID